MAELETVIKGLECCVKNMGECELCPYDEGRGKCGCGKQLYADALALLKAQEPRVMTLEEVKSERIFWIEDADDGMTVRLFPATMFGTGEYADGSKSCIFLAQKPWIIDVDNYEWWYLIEDYGETWRCWTSRPTDEQREKEPWNG